MAVPATPISSSRRARSWATRPRARLPQALGRQGIESFARHDLPWPCGVPGGGETPNLMLGLAGIGYFYLRLYDPGRFRSVLLLRPREADPA